MTRWLMVALVVVLFAGGLFGYDQGVISGVLFAREVAMQYAAPTALLRCLFVSDYQMAIMIGIFLAYLVNGWLSRSDWRASAGRRTRWACPNQRPCARCQHGGSDQ